MDSVRWKRQDFAKIDRLVVFERFVCKEICFKFNALFDWEPVKFLQDRFNEVKVMARASEFWMTWSLSSSVVLMPL